jgi:hypothetical protein
MRAAKLNGLNFVLCKSVFNRLFEQLSGILELLDAVLLAQPVQHHCCGKEHGRGIGLVLTCCLPAD